MYIYITYMVQRRLRVRMMNSLLAPASHLLLHQPAADVYNYRSSKVMAATNSGFPVFRFGFRVWVSGFEFRISGFGFRVSGCEFRASGFGFRVEGKHPAGVSPVGGANHALPMHQSTAFILYCLGTPFPCTN